MKGNDRLRRFWMPLLLLALFLNFQVGITAFRHAHIVNGVVIVHSHPFSDNQHAHTSQQIVTIAYLSTMESTEANIAPVFVCCPPPVQQSQKILYVPTHLIEVRGHNTQWRAPPFCC